MAERIYLEHDTYAHYSTNSFRVLENTDGTYTPQYVIYPVRWAEYSNRLGNKIEHITSLKVALLCAYEYTRNPDVRRYVAGILIHEFNNAWEN